MCNAYWRNNALHAMLQNYIMTVRQHCPWVLVLCPRYTHTPLGCQDGWLDSWNSRQCGPPDDNWDTLVPAGGNGLNYMAHRCPRASHNSCNLWKWKTLGIPGTCVYRKISNIRCTKSQNLNDSHLVLQLSLPCPLKSGVKSRMKM